MESMENQLEPESVPWSDVAPILDAAMAQLGEKDHSAIVLRYFEGQDLKQVGAALGVSENAAKTRVSRATEKLRQFFHRRGITMSSVALAEVVSAHSVQSAPLGMAASVSSTAFHGTAASPVTLSILKTTLKIMAWTKLKTAVVVAVVIAGAVTATVSVRRAKAPEPSSPFTFAGYAAPEDAWNSMAWAVSVGKLDKVKASCTPAQYERLMKKMAGKSPAEISEELIHHATTMVGFQVTQKEVISDDEVRLLLLVPPSPDHPKVGHDLQVMQKVGGQWKYAGKWGVDIK
jgi:DNA-binding CsgD family transcriptional regulator